MNFLGHCLFSDPTPEALAGSLWPDFARRPTDPGLSDNFYRHFDRHQSIDHVTDHDPLLEPLREELRPVFRKTTPVVIDMMLDHHLARHWHQYHHQTLEPFAQFCYRKLNEFDELAHPERMQRTLYWMQKQDWFVSYRHKDGIRQAMQGMSRRIRFNNPMCDNREVAIEATLTHEARLDTFVQRLKEKFAL